MIDVKEYSKLIEQLIDWPLENAPYPEGYPDELKYDPYPGKDFVVGVCEEQIEILVDGAQNSKGDKRDVLLKFADLFEKIKLRRQHNLSTLGLV
jgi:hypothetical protein